MITSVDTNKLRSLIESFHNLTGMKVAVFNTDFQAVLSYPENESVFCTMMRKNKDFCDSCHASEKRLCIKCAKEQRVIIEKCHAGLTEVIAPLSNGISIIGYIMFGQITNAEDRDGFVADVLARCKKYKAPEEALKNAAMTVPYYTDKQAQDAAAILNALGVYIVFEKIVYTKEKSLAWKITEYIKNNPGKDLSAETLCKLFSVSKSTLYKELRPYLPDGMAGFIKNVRIDAAKELLSGSELPVWEIARVTGFSDADYFLRVFKKETGISAGKYRKERQG